MTHWLTTIIKNKTSDGFWSLSGTGKLRLNMPVKVDLDSRRIEKFKRTRDGAPFETEMVSMLEPMKMDFPVEMLDLD